MTSLPRTFRGVVTVSAAAALLVLPATAASAKGDDARVTVSGGCAQVQVSSTKDLSNVVLQFEDGDTQRFEGLTGRNATFSGTGANDGETITAIWVKSGNNKSGDGPGYGEKFTLDTSSCDGPSDSGGDTTVGGNDDGNTGGGNTGGGNTGGGNTGGGNTGGNTVGGNDDGNDGGGNDDGGNTGGGNDDGGNDDGNTGGDGVGGDDGNTGGDGNDDGGTTGGGDGVGGDGDGDSSQGDDDEVGNTGSGIGTPDSIEVDDESAGPDVDTEVLGATDSRDDDGDVTAAADTIVASDALPNTGADALTAALAALVALGLGAGMVRRSRA